MCLRYASLILVVISVLVVGGGCRRAGDSAARHVVSGTVHYQGKPVPRGRIEFEPDPSRGNRGPVGVAEIVDGRFRTNPRFGSVSGPLVVRITGKDGIPPADAGEGWVDPEGSVLFSNHVEAIEVAAGGAVLEFDVGRK